MSALFNEILYRPLLNALVFIHETIGFESLGLSIIVLTVIVRLVLFPFFQKSMKNQAIMQKIQPQIKAIQDKHKHDRESQMTATLELYREHKINPFSNFLFLIVQIPLLIAVYLVFRDSIGSSFFDGLYAFVPRPENLNADFLGLINLNERNIILVVLTAFLQYFQSRLALPSDPGPHAKLARQLVFVAPIITLVFFMNFPAAVTLYWFVMSAFSLGQQILVNRQLRHAELGTIRKKIS